MRSTGFRSLNKHVHGHCQDIAVQANEHKSLIYEWACALAAEEGLLRVKDVLGTPMPLHESEWTTKEASDVVELLHRTADERRWYLTEYLNGVATKVFYGKERA